MACHRAKVTYFKAYVVSNLKEIHSVVLDVVARQRERERERERHCAVNRCIK
jgi:hypothetical protein